MNARRLTALWLVALGLARSLVCGQENVPLKPFRTDDDKPVLRAQPVPKPVPVPEIPVATPIPRATPRQPAPSAKPSSAPKATPAPGPALPEPATGEITLKPGVRMTPEQIQLSIADNLYQKKMYDAAAPEYEKYLGLYPYGPDRAAVLFRLGESYRQNGSVNAAKSSFETLLNHFSDGEFIGPAAYRLADLYYSEKNFNAALPLYRRASVRIKDPKLANSAKFFCGRCLEGLGQKSEARAVYEDLVANPRENPFVDASQLSYALLLKDGGKTAEALKQIQLLAKQTENPDLKAQATVYSGLWELELDRPAKAAEELRKALEMPAIGRWKDVAQFGLVQLLFNSEKYQQVVDTYKANDKQFGPETRPQLLMIVAKAYRQLGKQNEALPIFEKILNEFPNTTYAREASYERLRSLYMVADASLISEIDKYLASNPDASNRDQVLLMKAEMLFKKPDYATAAPIYSQVAESRNLSGTLKAEALYKAGLCSLEVNELDRAVNSFTTLRERYPTFKAIPSAICRCALAKLRLNDAAGALKDFDLIIDKYPKTKERELSLYQKAKILGKNGDNQQMAETFKLLLKDYPETPERADANYWIGWVAYENKDYKNAAEPLSKAREFNKEEYFERASLRIMLSYFYLENKEAVAQEIDTYTKGGGKTQVPYEVLHWLGHSYYELAVAASRADARLESYIDQLQEAAKWLGSLSARPDARFDDFLELGHTFVLLREFDKAALPLQKYLDSTTDPAARAQGLLMLAKAEIGMKRFEDTKKSLDEALTLQPDGPINAETRIVAGDSLGAQEKYDEAAKVYESVSVIIDDEDITPRALEKAVDAYRKAGRDAEANKLLNTLQSRYPEYFQQKNRKPM